MVPTVFDGRANFFEKYSHLPRSNREWPRVVATEIMQLSWGVIRLQISDFLKKTSLLF